MKTAIAHNNLHAPRGPSRPTLLRYVGLRYVGLRDAGLGSVRGIILGHEKGSTPQTSNYLQLADDVSSSERFYH